jgi:hypothetical protein
VNISERRKFFDQLAEDKGFHPLEKENWYHITSHDVTNRLVFLLVFHDDNVLNSNYIVQGGNSVVYRHRGSHITALIECYPELELQREKFIQAQNIKTKLYM